MNIVKLQDDLKNVPDNALVGYVQNPSGQVPSYLALSELQRRKKMREQATGAQAQGQSNMPSVAEQLVAESAPQAGIAGIPVTNVGNEDAYASGGIVSFADGGSTEAYNRAARASFLGQGLDSLDEAAALAPTPGNAFKRMGSYFVDVLSGMRWVRNPYTGELVRAKDVVENPNAGALVQQPGMTNISGLLNVQVPSVDPDLPSMAPQVPIDQMRPQATPPADKADTGSAARTSSVGGMGVQRPAGIAGLTAPQIQDRSGEYVYTEVPEAMAEKQRYLEMMGEDPYAAKAKERIGAMEAENAKYKEQYPWMALAEAGFGMAAGKSPYALQNIAEGGQRGVTALYKGRKDVQEQEEKIFNAEAKVAESERALQTAAAKYGLDSEQTAKAANKLEKDKMFAYKTDIEAKNIQNKIEIDKFNKQQELENNRLTRQINADNARFSLQLKSIEKQTKSAYDREKIAAMSKSMENATAVYNTASKRYSDALKSMDANEIESAKIELAQAKKEYDLAQLYAKKVLGTTGGEYLGIEK